MYRIIDLIILGEFFNYLLKTMQREDYNLLSYCMYTVMFSQPLLLHALVGTTKFGGDLN